MFYKAREYVINLFNGYDKVVSEDFVLNQKPSNIYFSIKHCYKKLSDLEERQEKLKKCFVK